MKTLVAVERERERERDYSYKQKKNYKNSKILKKATGITLVALIVTIIILMILAGVVIATVTGNNGILNKSKLARDTYQNSINKENGQISSYENEIDKIALDVASSRETAKTSDGKDLYQRARSNTYIDVPITQNFTAPSDGYYTAEANVVDNYNNYLFIITHYSSEGIEIERRDIGGYSYIRDGCNFYMNKGDYLTFKKENGVTLVFSRFWYAVGEEPNQ